MPTPAGSQKKQENSRKTSTSASLITWNPLLDHNKLWKIIKDMQIPDHFTCQQVKNHQLEPDMEQQTGSKLGKEYVKAVYCHSAYLTYM